MPTVEFGGKTFTVDEDGFIYVAGENAGNELLGPFRHTYNPKMLVHMLMKEVLQCPVHRHKRIAVNDNRCVMLLYRQRGIRL